jgi:HEPN domain-containing protein
MGFVGNPTALSSMKKQQGPPSKTVPPTLSAKATYRRALQFLTAAKRLYASAKSHSQLGNPTYFLYFHTIELAFKAYLCSYGIEPNRGHELQKVYHQCRALGLVVGPDDLTNLGNVVTLLESGNEDHGFRYFKPRNGNLPDLAWTRETSARLLRVVARRMREIEYTSFPGPPVSGFLVVGKPRRGVPRRTFRRCLSRAPEVSARSRERTF